MNKKTIVVRDEIDLFAINIASLAEKYKDYPDATLVFDSYYDSAEGHVEYTRLETNEECGARLEKEKIQRRTKAEQDRKKREKALKQFEKLKEEYGFE